MRRSRRPAALALATLLLVAAADPRSESEHVVTRGETLSAIARRAGVPAVVIAEANGMPEGARVRPGQRLVIPRQQDHTVKRGETRFAIAYRYAVPWAEIAVANGLDADAPVHPGQHLIVPALLASRAAPESAAPARRAATPALPPLFQRPIDGEVLRGWRRRADGTAPDGIDFAAEDGDRVRAAGAGTVLFAGDEPNRFGKLVVLDHGNGWHSAYGNLSRITVRTGDTVRAGERIGLAGHTGDARRPQLHFEIRRGDRPVDPTRLIAPLAERAP